MASKRVIKESSLNNLRDLLIDEQENGVKIESTDRYRSLYEHFFNAFEKENIKTILELLRDGKENSEIIIDVINAVTTDVLDKKKKKEAKKSDPVAEETEAIFILHEQRVVEVPKVDVVIGGVDTPAKEYVEKDDNEEKKSEPIFILHERKVVDAPNPDNPIDRDNGTVESKKTEETVSKKSKRDMIKEKFNHTIKVFKRKKEEPVEQVVEEDPNAISVSTLYQFNTLENFLEDLIKSADEIISA